MSGPSSAVHNGYLPMSEPCPSYWQQKPSDIAQHCTTSDLPKTADVIIIGSGISGSSIAYNLLSAVPSLKIVLLEARAAVSGATGRNGGHTKGASYRSFLGNVEHHGLEDAIRIAKLEYDCMVAVHDFARREKIACDSRRCQTVDVFYDAEQLDHAQTAVARMVETMGRSEPAAIYNFHDPAQTREKFLAADSVGSVTYEAGSINAYAFATGVLTLALEKGLNLQTFTPVTSIDTESGYWSAQTRKGSISAPRMILATNGYTAQLLPDLREAIIPFRGVVTAQRPGKSLPRHGNLDSTYSFVYREGYEYMITRPSLPVLDKDASYDIVIGGGLTKGPGSGREELYTVDDTFASIPTSIEKYLANSTATFFGDNWGKQDDRGTVKFTHTGIMGYSADGQPFVGEVPGKPGLWIDASFQGHGMVLCWLCATAVSQLLLADISGGTAQVSQAKKELALWFPESYYATEERMRKKFKGHLIGRELGEKDETSQVEAIQ